MIGNVKGRIQLRLGSGRRLKVGHARKYLKKAREMAPVSKVLEHENGLSDGEDGQGSRG